MAYPILLGIPIFGSDKADRNESPVPLQKQPIHSIVSEKSAAKDQTSNYRPPRASPAAEDEDDVQIASKGTRRFSYWPLRTASAPPEDDQDSIFRTISERKSLVSRDAKEGVRHVSPAGHRKDVVQDAPPVRTPNDGPQPVLPASRKEDEPCASVPDLSSGDSQDEERETRSDGQILLDGFGQTDTAQELPQQQPPPHISPALTDGGADDDDDNDGFAALTAGDFESDGEDFTPTCTAGGRFDCTSGLGSRGRIDKGKGRVDLSVLDLSMRSSGGGTEELDRTDIDVQQQASPRGTKRPPAPGASREGNADLRRQSNIQNGVSEDPTQAKRPRLADGCPLPERLRQPPDQQTGESDSVPLPCLDPLLDQPAQRHHAHTVRGPPPTTHRPEEEATGASEQSNRPAQRRRRGRAAKEPRPAIYRASIKELYKPPDAKMLLIVRCLEKGNHPSTTKAEVSAAMRQARRLMAEYNVAEDEVLIHMPVEEQAKRGSESIACVRRVVENGKKVQLGVFVKRLSAAMAFFFDCKSYSTGRTAEVAFTFYGIAENTVPAAVAFVNIHNLIVEWARGKKGISYTRSYCAGVVRGLEESAEETKAEELKLAERAEAERLADREEDERAQRQRELDRLRPLGDASEPETGDGPSPSVPALESSGSRFGSPAASIVDLTADTSDSDSDESMASDALDDTDHDVDMSQGSGRDSGSGSGSSSSNNSDSDSDSDSDFDSESEGGSDVDEPDIVMPDETGDNNLDSAPMPPPPAPPRRLPSTSPPPSTPVASAREETPWQSSGQLIAFRERASTVADEWLKLQNIKLRAGRKRAPIKDWSAWRKGKKDSEKIDIREQARR